jgi:small subunit ribosomal protein S16
VSHGWVAVLRVSAPDCLPIVVELCSTSPKGFIMVVIRLARGGAKARPFFNIVVADKRTRRDGRFIERIGFYNPIATANEESIRIAQDRLTYWRSVGAQASPTVERLVAQAAKKAA